MERYSRVSSSKWQSIYSEEFKRFVCNEYLTGSMTKSEVESKHKLGNGRLTYWLRERGYDDLKTRIVSLPDMRSDKINISEKDTRYRGYVFTYDRADLQFVPTQCINNLK